MALPLSKPPVGGREHPLFTHELPVGMISGENPRYPSVPGGHNALKQDLSSLGVQFEETNGSYGGHPEHSFLVYGLPREHLYALGKKYGQDAVIHNEAGKRELLYTNGAQDAHYHPGLSSFDHWPEGSHPPDDYFTKLPGHGHGHVRLHFDADNLHPAPLMANAPGPAPLAPTARVMGKHEVAHQLYRMLKNIVTPPPMPHPHAYQWHDTHTDHHYRGHGPGGVLISRALRKDEQPHPHMDSPPGSDNEQRGGAGIASYHQFAVPFGHIDQDAKARGGSSLLHYNYFGKGPHVEKLLADHGYQAYIAGGPWGKPDLANRNYNTKHLMIYDPRPGAGGDSGHQEYTENYRKVHELAHALTYPDINKLYGEGRRIGKLGHHRTAREALRAVHWEWLAVHKQRELNRSLGLEIPDNVFNRELNTVMHDAAHRAVTGQFTEPSQEGFTPFDHQVPLETSLGLVRDAARNLGLTGMNDLKKSQGSNEVAEDKKLSVPEALNVLHTGLKRAINDYEQKCLDLRKAELAKSARTPKFLNDEYKRHADAGNHHEAAEVATALHHFHSEALHGSHGNHDGEHDAYHDKKQKHWHSVATEHRAMAGLKKAAVTHGGMGSSSPAPVAGGGSDGFSMSEDAKLEAYAKGEYPMKKGALPGELAHTTTNEPTKIGAQMTPPPGPPPQLKSEMSLCKACGMKKDADHDCDRAEAYAKGEKKMGKYEGPAGSAPEAPGPKVGVLPDDKKPKKSPSQAEGSGGEIKKAALGAAPAPAAGVQGAPKVPKLPGMGKPAMGGGMPKPAAPAAPKTPAMGAGQPSLKAEIKPSFSSQQESKKQREELNAKGKMQGVQPAKMKTGHAMASMKKTVTLPGTKAAMAKPSVSSTVAPAPAPAAASHFGATPMKREALPSPKDEQRAAQMQPGQAIKLPGVRASVGGLMDNMLAQHPNQPAAAPQTMKPAAGMPPALAGVGQPKAMPAQGVKTMAERVASSLQPPPAEGRPGAKLPGAHLFAPKAPTKVG